MVQEIGGATHRDLKLLQRFLRSSRSLENLETAMLLLEDGLFGFKYQAVGRGHGITL